MLTGSADFKRLFRLSTVVLLIACSLLTDGIWILAKAWLAEGLIAAAWLVTTSHDQRIRPWPWADTWPVARMEVPRLGVKRHILAGVSGRTLAFAPGWAMQTPPPGASGTSLVAGHRDTHFRFLKNLQQGDRLLLDTPHDGQIIYRVTASAIVDQRQDRLKNDAAGRGLILVTCYPFEALVPGGDLRFVVWAEAEPGELFGLESRLNPKITPGPNEADPNIPSSGLSTPRLSG
ncbi:MAG: sortase, marine proteobacterial type [gamma proteobacterium symbiont of Ctena orbiculata]|uniref:Class GN sortase n=1 Tax=Candidatus Thiodiazotropha taylori TaxID=2792791 RepID=A0A944QW88_9GAMM|nr:class GN sortase [Candidatus Thiodiazotropha taylori]PUB82678.1 MAG: class GN sortase [gamma proteobacterium symbiont of Ctena orbiculata]MBT2990076.1 class GN sortase [Candidatus Thiodiazotropha taylori]MBT2997904.1 class GN sortase [Candidatus Thiodiazotropha taylori]MBT3001692.1 class GN sortase [Candidatus Thiodiazotropha taylori]